MSDGADQPGCDGSLAEPQPRREAFVTTRWSMIVAAGRKADVRAHTAMEELCRTYWYPLKPCLTAERGALNYAGIAARFGMSEGAVRVAAHRLRRQYRELLRAEIAETLADPAQFEDEPNALYAAFSG
jgi:RNA polymerase sigma-70 factor (ECF subfamily)